jgi:hypothetical protein
MFTAESGSSPAFAGGWEIYADGPSLRVSSRCQPSRTLHIAREVLFSSFHHLRSFNISFFATLFRYHETNTRQPAAMPARTTTTTTTATAEKSTMPTPSPSKALTKTFTPQLLLNILTITLVFAMGFVWHSTRPARDITGTVVTAFRAHEAGMNRLLSAVDGQRQDVGVLIQEVEVLVRAVENAQKNGDWKKVHKVGSEIAGKGKAWLGQEAG